MVTVLWSTSFVSHLSIDLYCIQNLIPINQSIDQSIFGFRVNEVGVDINKALIHTHTANLLQFVCGLGPRKAQFIIRTLKQNKRLENRSQLVHICQMGPKVFMNSAGKMKQII